MEHSGEAAEIEEIAYKSMGERVKHQGERRLHARHDVERMLARLTAICEGVQPCGTAPIVGPELQ
eukprot:5020200-Heterocapsa_arctica.AAC.1